MPGARSTVIGKMISVLLTAGFIFVILPVIHFTSFFVVVVIVASIGIISWSLSQFLAGDHGPSVLVPAALAVVADLVVFYLVPGLVP